MQGNRQESNSVRLNGDDGMRVNYVVCDICGERFECGEGFKCQVTYPIDERVKNMVSRHHYRKQKTLDLCIVCGVERLGLHDTEKSTADTEE